MKRAKSRRVVCDSDDDDGDAAPPDPEPGWPPRLTHTWDVIVAAAVQKIRPYSVGSWKMRDLGKPYPGGTNVRMFLCGGVVAELLRTRHHEVLHAFDANGVSFCGFFETWQPYALDAAELWLAAVSHASAPRVFTSHDYRHRLRRTWTLRDVMSTFPDTGKWVAQTRVAVRAGVTFGTPTRKETRTRLLKLFAREPRPELLAGVLGEVLAAPLANVHWDFEVPFPEEAHAWAAPVFDWFSAQLKARLVDDALRAAIAI